MVPRDELLRVKRLASRANARIKDWAGLHERANREILGLTLAEGARLAGEALREDVQHGADAMKPVAFLLSDTGAAKPEAGDLFALAGARRVERFSLSDDCFDKISGLKNAEGVAVVLACDYGPVSFEPLAAPDARWLIAAGVQDPGNAGALARTALAAGCTGCLYLDGADTRSPKFLRGGMGAAFRFPCLSTTLDHFLSSHSDLGINLVAAASDGGTDYRRVEYRLPYALVIGGEKGLPPGLAALPMVRAHIPLAGGVESLNLAVAAGIMLFSAATEE